MQSFFKEAIPCHISYKGHSHLKSIRFLDLACTLKAVFSVVFINSIETSNVSKLSDTVKAQFCKERAITST